MRYFIQFVYQWNNVPQELTAKYKTKIINSGRGIDLTGGFGVDSIFISKQSESLIYCERDKDLALLVNHNLKVFKQDNCKIHWEMVSNI